MKDLSVEFNSDGRGGGATLGLIMGELADNH